MPHSFEFEAVRRGASERLTTSIIAPAAMVPFTFNDSPRGRGMQFVTTSRAKLKTYLLGNPMSGGSGCLRPLCQYPITADSDFSTEPGSSHIRGEAP